MRNERPIHLSPEDFTGEEPPLEDQGYWRKKMSPLPRFLIRKRGDTVEKEEPSLSSITSLKKQRRFDSSKDYPFGEGYKKSKEIPSNIPNVSYQPITQGRYVLVMTRLSMWTIAFCLLLLGVLFYLAGFFSALYLLSASSHLGFQEIHTEKASLQQKIGTFIDKIEHKSPPSTPPAGSATSSGSPSQQVQPSQSTSSLSLETQSNSLPAAPLPTPGTQINSIPPSSTSTENKIPTEPVKNIPSPSSNKENLPAEEPYFMLQFGEFRTRDSAISLAQSLLSKGYHAKVFRSLDSTNKLWFYVRANAYPSRAAAQQAIQQLSKSEKSLFPLIIPSDLNQHMKIIFP